MYQRDYILRIIEQLGQALRELRARLTGEPVEGADPRAELAAAAARAGVDLDLIRSVDPDTLRLIVFPSGEPDPARCWLFAELMCLDGIGRRGTDRDAQPSFARARLLFTWLEPTYVPSAGHPPPAERIAEIDSYFDS